MNRLQRPWEALRLPLHDLPPDRRHADLQDRYGSGGRNPVRAHGCAAGRDPGHAPSLFEAETLLAQVASFAELSSAMVKEIEVRRDGEWGQRLLKDRAADRQCDGRLHGPRDQGSRRRAADAERTPAISPERWRAEKRASGSQLCAAGGGRRKFAAAASFAAKQQTASEEIGHHLRRYIEDAVREVESGEGEQRVAAEFQLQYCAELAAMLFSEEEAELIRRRRAAQSAAA